MPLDIRGYSEVLNTRAGVIKDAFNSKLQTDFVTAQKLTEVRTAGTYTAPNIEVGDFIQAYQGAFTPKNTTTIDAEKLELQELKIDILWTEEQLNSFLKKWKPQNSQFGDSPLTNKFFTDFLMTNYVYPKCLADFENKLVMKGEYVAPTSGTPGVTINSCDGLFKRIETAQAANRLTYVTVGSISTTNIYDKTIGFCRSLPEPEQDIEGEILCSRQYLQMFADAVYAKGQTVIDPRTLGNFKEYPIPNTNKKLVCLPSMSGNMGLIFTPKQDNLIMLLPTSDMNESGQMDGLLPYINWETQTRELRGWGNFQVAFGFEYGAQLYVSDTIAA